MKNDNCYESYSLRIVLLSNIVLLAIYTAGAFITYQIGWIWLILYILYILRLEIRILKNSCANCYYYGKLCAFGKGKLSCLFFKQGDKNRFKRKQVSWKDVIPDLLVSLIPLIIGIVLLVINFNWLLLSFVLMLLIFTSVGNGIIRGSIACKYCKQREIGCPAEQLFNRDKRKAQTVYKS